MDASKGQWRKGREKGIDVQVERTKRMNTWR